MGEATTYLLRKYDDTKPTHILRELYLPAGEIWQARGYLFVPPELAARLGDSDATVTFGEFTYPAWRMAGDMPVEAPSFVEVSGQ